MTPEERSQAWDEFAKASAQIAEQGSAVSEMLKLLPTPYPRLNSTDGERRAWAEASVDLLKYATCCFALATASAKVAFMFGAALKEGEDHAN